MWARCEVGSFLPGIDLPGPRPRLEGAGATLSCVTRYSLRGLRLRPGEEHREVVAIDLEPFVLGGETYSPQGAATEAGLVVQRATSGDVFHLSFSATLRGPCMRCLGEAEVSIDVLATEYQDASPSAGPELRTEYVKASDLLLTSWARDLIGSELPEQILCRPDCLGLCGLCGKNLNLEPHEHEDVPGDPRWAALEALRSIDAD